MALPWFVKRYPDLNFPVSFPPELLSHIIRDVCYNHDPRHPAFRRACCRMTLVSRAWQAVANSTPSLWRYLLVEYSTSQLHLAAFLRNSGEAPLFLCFRANAPIAADPDMVRQSLLESAVYISHTIRRWVAIDVELKDASVFHSVLLYLASLPSPPLRVLRLACAVPRHADRRSSFAYGFHGPTLRQLALDGAPPWSSPSPPTVALTRLSLHQCSWPNYSDFFEFVSLTSALRHLSIGTVRFAGTLPATVVHLPSLDHVDLLFGSNVDSIPVVASLFSRLTYPALLEVAISFNGYGSVSEFLRTPLAFRASSARLSGICSIDEDFADVYHRLFGVVTLDLSHGQRAMVSALSAEKSHALPLPSLSTLLLYMPNWRSLLDVISSRNDGQLAPLHLRCNYPEHLAVTHHLPHIADHDLESHHRVLSLVSSFSWIHPM
ncbi:hypothetical protein B0H16DRAFT_1447878 [Mycena metata]|uniref:F-box domain-containing protein n=1 Tax=Mycena metata TaxID=1033252 RepID=A0AAD7KA88_9AGAR|nr:hypothetical protein B0H16DRAFT_1447878 [Mycena metata]